MAADPRSQPTPAPAPRREVHVGELRRRLGTRRVVDIDLELQPVEVVASRNTADPVTGSLTIESIERGVTVSGTLSFGWEGECRRCLEAVAGTAEVDVMEIFQVDAPPDTDDISELVGDTVDLGPVVRDAVLAALPLAPLCRDDCAGPDPDRYPTVNESDLELPAPTPDPRWAVLDELDLTDG